MISRSVCRLGFLLVVTAGALGCARERPAAPAPDEPAGPVTTDKTPDGQPLVVTFPGKPEWAQVPDLAPPTQGFVWRGNGTEKQRAVWVWTIPPEERARHNDQDLSSEYALKAANVSNNSAYFFYGLDPRGGGRGGWQSRPHEGQEWDKRPGAEGAGAGVVLIVGDKAYCLRVWGTGLAVGDPECRAFFDSLKPAEWDGRPEPAGAPADDLRPFASDGRFHNLAGVGTHTGGVAFCPGRGAVLRATYSDARDAPAAGLVRYRYPSFRPDGTYKLPDPTHIIASDPGRNRLYLSTPGARARVTLARFDVPERAPGAGAEEEVTGLKAAELEGTVAGVCVAPDGEHLFVIREWDRRQSAELLRFETQGMTRTHALPLPRATTSLCRAPDGKTLYAAFDTGLEKVGPDYGGGWMSGDCRVQEIDAATVKVRRTFSVRANAGTLTCGADGRLYSLAPGGQGWVRVDPTGPGEPKVKSVANNDSYRDFVLSPDAKRLYALSGGQYPYSLDTKELFDYGRFVYAPEEMKTFHARTFGPNGLAAMRGSFAVVEGGTISPDGKCLFLNSGHAFWLTGAGPLPEVDPAMRWNPRHKPPQGPRPGPN